MKVFPDGKLYIISGCPCDPDYEHTLYWPNKEGQHAYFLTKAKYRVDNMSYQRAKRGRVRVQYKVEDLYDCNYIAFQNSSFGNKWFYAFIDDVTYVNNITSEISYTIDVIQTWITEMDLQQCFVEREHSVTDGIGDNITGENLPTGEYIGTGLEPIKGGLDTYPAFRDWVIVVATAVDESGVTNPGGFYGRLYSQVEYKVFPATAEGITNLSTYWNKIDLLNRSNIILNCFMMPSAMIATKASSPSDTYYKNNFWIPKVTSLKRTNGNPPKNNKLMTYPYTYLEVTNMQGTVKQYAYELFSDDAQIPSRIVFHGFVDTSPNPTFVFMPKNYKGNVNPNPDERITLGNFPMCAWAVGDFLNKSAQLISSMALIGLTAGIAGTPGTPGKVVPTTPPINVGAGNAPQLSNTALMVRPPEYTPPIAGVEGTPGTPGIPPALTNSQAIVAQMMMNNFMSMGASRVSGGSDSMFNAGWFTICHQQKMIRPEYVDMIDDYFSRYGYATRLIKTPNISSRPQWNYVQTVGCKIGGSIPCQDEKLICSIFDHGVTFWKHPENVCNYSLDNSPT